MINLKSLAMGAWAMPQISFVLMAGCGILGYLAGDHQRDNAWKAKMLVAEVKARQDLEAEVERSQKAAISFTAEYLSFETQFTKLEGQFHELRARVPLVVFKPVAAPEKSASNSPGTNPATEPPTALFSAPLAVDLELSRGAVWLWNSALAGADMPAGACGAADTSSQACAPGAGIGLEAAFANHEANAKTCALDRLRHQRLIDYLNASSNASRHDR